MGTLTIDGRQVNMTTRPTEQQKELLAKLGVKLQAKAV
jgi:hypothetical protein